LLAYAALVQPGDGGPQHFAVAVEIHHRAALGGHGHAFDGAARDVGDRHSCWQAAQTASQ
jgi:hypothetical protein